MEKRITQKFKNHIDLFKSELISIVETDNKTEILDYIKNFDSLTLSKEDFTKRKRVKSVIPHYLRCMAKRANGEQCTRKKKDDICYCGTHEKNRPHGIINSNSKNEENKIHKVEVWLQEINGILYYIDNNNNVYNTQDIMASKVSPNIHAKYKVEDGKYFIIN